MVRQMPGVEGAAFSSYLSFVKWVEADQRSEEQRLTRSRGSGQTEYSASRKGESEIAPRPPLGDPTTDRTSFEER